MGRGRCFSQRRKVAKVMARGGWDHELDEWHEKGIGRARAQRSGARYRNRCARCGVGGGGRGLRASGISRRRGDTEGLCRVGPRNGRSARKGGSVVLVLSEAVLVIVIDARDGLGRGWRASGISRRRGGTEGLGGGWRAGVATE